MYFTCLLIIRLFHGFPLCLGYDENAREFVIEFTVCFVCMMQKRRLYPKKSLSSEPSKCDASVKRLRSAILVKEEEVLELREEGTYLSRLAARTIRKGLHCLSLQLTIQYYNHLRKETHSTNRTILEDDRLYHYIIYSENVLAAAVVVNSTTTNAKVTPILIAFAMVNISRRKL